MPAAVDPWGGAFTVERGCGRWRLPAWRKAVVINQEYQTNGFRFGYDAELRPVFWTSESGGTTELTVSATTQFDRWCHVAAVRSGATATILVNGAPAGSTALGYVPPVGGGSSGASNGNPAGARFNEVAVYPTALSADRVMAHYLAGAGEAVPLGHRPSNP